MRNSFGRSLAKSTRATPGIRAKRGSTNSSICFWNCAMSKSRLSLLKSFGVTSNVAAASPLLPPANTTGSNASNGRGGAWLRLVNTSSMACCMFCPTAKVNVIEPLPRLM